MELNSFILSFNFASSIIMITLQYCQCLAYFLISSSDEIYEHCNFFQNDTHAKVQIFSLALILKLYRKKHYRSESFRKDMIDNLKNVAIPGTGIPISIFCYHEITILVFLFILNPTICFFGALNKALNIKNGGLLAILNVIKEEYEHHLLHPDDWFSLWRMNCRLVSYASNVTKSIEYKMEDKWTFLIEGKALSIPVSPFDDLTEAIVCKNKLIEGGMGIHFFKNASHGGDWIIQKRLMNDDWLNQLLPENAPLSTMRIITTSTYAISVEFPRNKSATLLSEYDPVINASDDANRFVRAESAVLRLGRMDANTDHSSVLFDVDICSGEIHFGTTNSHWYQLGLDKVIRTPWLPPSSSITHHIDFPFPLVTGSFVPNMRQAVEIVTSSHFKMMKEVPIVGWDVAFTKDGIFLLEVNLSCNFFRGSVNIPRYVEFLDSFWVKLQKMESLDNNQTDDRKFKREKNS